MTPDLSSKEKVEQALVILGHGDEVVKQALIILGYGDGERGGPNDPISIFQEIHQLKIDGIAGPVTRAAILKSLQENET